MSDMTGSTKLVSDEEENVKVIVRVRPLSSKEEHKGCQSVVNVDKSRALVILTNPSQHQGQGHEQLGGGGSLDGGGGGSGTGSRRKTFAFDGVFPADTRQADLYNAVARPIVDNVIEGYNGTIIAYGQTGTGKTFTMEGEPSVPELKGIIPNSFAQIFTHISNCSEEQMFLVRVSYLEIYNEDVRDLLAKDCLRKLEIKERPDKGVYVKDLSSFVVQNAADMDRIMAIGNKNRSVGATNMNVSSSRSHAIFTITVECSSELSGLEAIPSSGTNHKRSLRMGKLNLVDLAGSERLSKTGATGQRLKEGAKINLSLSALGNVISALVEGQSHVPYRSSKLTRLLQDSLGGNSKTVMVANIGPADYNYDETLSTLRYADRAKQIKNHARINEDPKDALLRQFEAEIEALRKQLEEEEADGHIYSTGSNYGDDPEEFMGNEVSQLLEDNPSEETLEHIKGELQSHMELSSAADSVARDKHHALSALKDGVKTYEEHEAQRAALKARLKGLKNKIMIGGENLLDKSRAQEEFLQRSMQELEKRKEAESHLANRLSSKQKEKLELEDRVLKAQTNKAAIDKTLLKTARVLQREKAELDILHEEREAEKEVIQEDLRRLRREIQKVSMVVDYFVPPGTQEVIQNVCTWSDENGCWSLPYIAYAGNNMMRSTGGHQRGRSNMAGDYEGSRPTKMKNMSHVYLKLHPMESASSSGRGSGPVDEGAGDHLVEHHEDFDLDNDMSLFAEPAASVRSNPTSSRKSASSRSFYTRSDPQIH